MDGQAGEWEGEWEGWGECRGEGRVAGRVAGQAAMQAAKVRSCEGMNFVAMVWPTAATSLVLVAVLRVVVVWMAAGEWEG